MKSFDYFVREGKVKAISPDPALARSLMSQAEDRLSDLSGLHITEKNASFRFEQAYECLREAIQAFMAIDGYKPYSHEAVFAYAYVNKLLSEAESMAADRYREIRNDINYKGQKTAKEEAEEILAFIKKALSQLKGKFKSMT